MTHIYNVLFPPTFWLRNYRNILTCLTFNPAFWDQIYTYIPFLLQNCKNLSGLKKYKFIILQFWRSQFLKSRYHHGFAPFRGFMGEYVPCLFQLLETAYILPPAAPSSHHFILCIRQYISYSECFHYYISFSVFSDPPASL